MPVVGSVAPDWRFIHTCMGLDEKAIESSLVGGAGLALVRAGTLPLAQIDLAVERGSRTSGSVTEDYWRSTVSLRLAGF